MLNGDAVNVGGYIMPSLGYHDAISTTINNLLFILPLFMGRQFFRSYESQLLMFKMLVIAGLGYSILMLYEIRMSPQLHSSLYGYFPHNFGQQKRFGGFRPVVFMGHGLWVAFFTAVVLISAAVLWQNNEKIRRFSPATITYYFVAVLILCKSMASLFYGVFGLVMVKFIRPKSQIRLALFLVVLALLYPTMSIMKIFPHQN